jgi:hypothetical protein
LIFLRVDSTRNVDGNYPNDPTNPPVSLYQLFTTPTRNGLPQISSRFDQHGYTKQGLITQLVQILKYYQPDTLRTQDPADCQPGYTCDQYGMTVDYPNANKIFDLGCDGTAYAQQHNGQYPTNFYDHSDHVWGARFARQALKAYDKLLGVKLPSTYSIYNGYNLEWIEDPATRVTTKDFCLKKSIFFRYALHDDAATAISSAAASIGFDCYSYDYVGYQKGQVITPLP